MSDWLAMDASVSVSNSSIYYIIGIGPSILVNDSIARGSSHPIHGWNFIEACVCNALRDVVRDLCCQGR